MENNENSSLTISERIMSAITVGALMLVGGLALILLSPVFFIKRLLNKKKNNWASMKKALDELGDKLDDMTDPDSGEDWKKDHNSQYGQ